MSSMELSEGGLIGNNLLTEHVHPNIEGQFVLADAFYTSIVSSGVIDAAPDPTTSRDKDFYRDNWAYTDMDSLIGVYKIKHLKSDWPFSPLGNEITFRDTFQASGLLDSLAFSILTNPEASIQSLHFRLAGHFEENEEFELSLNEYEALICINPYHSDYYNRAANCLLKLNDLYAAEEYLRESVQYGKNLYAYSLLGEIETIKHNYKGAMNLYNDALELDVENKSDDAKLRELLSDIRRKLSDVNTRSRHPWQKKSFLNCRKSHLNIQTCQAWRKPLTCKELNIPVQDRDRSVFSFSSQINIELMSF